MFCFYKGGVVKRRKCLFLVFSLFVTVAPVLSYGSSTSQKRLLRDGFLLEGVDGRLIAADSNEGGPGGSVGWLFEFASAITDGKRQVPAGTRLELLPSAILEQMSDYAQQRPGLDYRLWGRVTKYRGRNYVFPTYFLGLRPMEPEEVESEQPRVEGELSRQGGGEAVESPPVIDERDDVLTLPPEVIEKVKSGRAVQPRSAAPATDAGEPNGSSEPVRQDRPQTLAAVRSRSVQNSVLAGRVGVIRRRFLKDGGVGEQLEFLCEGLGLKVGRTAFGLLPCEALESAERQMAQPHTPRLRVIGIVSEYKGRCYMLLERAVQVYSHGNFTR